MNSRFGIGLYLSATFFALFALSGTAYASECSVTSGSATSGFETSLEQLCHLTAELCEASADEALCPSRESSGSPLNYLNEINDFDSSAQIRIQRESLIENISRDVYAFADRTEPQEHETNHTQLREHEIRDYIQKLQAINHLSATDDPIVYKTVVDLSVHLMNIWSAEFSDLITQWTLYEEKETERLGGSILTILGVFMLADEASPKKLRQHTPSLFRIFRKNTSLARFSRFSWAGALTVSGGALFAHGVTNRPFDVPPSPAHLIQFGDDKLRHQVFKSSQCLQDNYDCETFISQQDHLALKEIIASSSSVGAMLATSHAGGLLTHPRLATRAPKALLHFLTASKLAKITPAGLLVGFAADMGVRKLVKTWKLNDLENRLDEILISTSKSRTDSEKHKAYAELTNAFNSIDILFLQNSYHQYQSTMDTLSALATLDKSSLQLAHQRLKSLLIDSQDRQSRLSEKWDLELNIRALTSLNFSLCYELNTHPDFNPDRNFNKSEKTLSWSLNSNYVTPVSRLSKTIDSSLKEHKRNLIKFNNFIQGYVGKASFQIADTTTKAIILNRQKTIQSEISQVSDLLKKIYGSKTNTGRTNPSYSHFLKSLKHQMSALLQREREQISSSTAPERRQVLLDYYECS